VSGDIFMMKIAYLHYHLKIGGVTTVLKQQINAVKNDCSILVLSGASPDPGFPADVSIIKGAGYHIKGIQQEKSGDAADNIIRAIYSRWPDGCDILHVHNPILAKNSSFLTILKILQEKGIRLFLQVHDFAEDGRPTSYFEESYPSDCHYGVINSRDYNILLNAGLNRKGLHKIFNMVNTLDFGEYQDQREGYVLYPVRAIRRKNIGEAILVSLFFKNREKLVITLPPNSRQDILSHEEWKQFVSEKRLDVELEASARHDFADLVMNAKFILTTSITEGFGFSFSEPWTAGKILWGRKIPDICADFEKNGIVFKDFYTKLNVPLEWVGRKAFLEKWKSCARKNLALFGVNQDSWNIDRFYEKITENELVDFGLLDENFQKKIIMRIITDRHDVMELKRINPFLLDLDPKVPESIISNNRNVVLESYGNDIYRKALLKIYKEVTCNNVTHKIDKKKLLFSFLNPQGFSLLKWEPYD